MPQIRAAPGVEGADPSAFTTGLVLGEEEDGRPTGPVRLDVSWTVMWTCQADEATCAASGASSGACKMSDTRRS